MKPLLYTFLALLFVAGTSMTALAQASKNTNISISEKNGLKKITIKKTLEDGTTDVINWEGTGKIPAEIKKEMEKGGAFSIHTGKGKFNLYSDDSVKVGNGPHKIMIITDKEGDNNLDKEVEIIVEEVKNSNVIRIDKNGKIDLDEKNLDMDIQIHTIDDDSDEKHIEIIMEQASAANHVDKLVIIKRVEVITESQTNESKVTNEAKSEVIELAPQVLERSLNLQDFQISPNPATDLVNLSFKGARVPTTIRLLGLDGKQIYKEFIRDFGGVYQNNIDLRDIRSSFIIVNIEQDGKVYSEKLAVKR